MRGQRRRRDHQHPRPGEELRQAHLDVPRARRHVHQQVVDRTPRDVLEEYLRPARLVENGVVVLRPALSERELIDIPGIGTLEAFNTDGLRTLARTIKAANMKEKTLRYRGHAETMAVLRETGFLNREEIEVAGTRIAPLDLAAKLLSEKWLLGEGDRDITVFKLIVEGAKGGVSLRYTYDMLDRYDARTRVHSMARTTGYAATQAVRMMAGGLFRRAGVNPPEYVGREPQCVEFMLRGLRERGIVYTQTIERPRA